MFNSTVARHFANQINFTDSRLTSHILEYIRLLTDILGQVQRSNGRPLSGALFEDTKWLLLWSPGTDLLMLVGIFLGDCLIKLQDSLTIILEETRDNYC